MTSRMSSHESDAIQPYDSDHTALVHVIWDARHHGLDVESADELVAHITRSKWMRAVRQHARQPGGDMTTQSARVSEFLSTSKGYQAIRRAIADPGAVVERRAFGNCDYEDMLDWQARAVRVALRSADSEERTDA